MIIKPIRCSAATLDKADETGRVAGGRTLLLMRALISISLGVWPLGN